MKKLYNPFKILLTAVVLLSTFSINSKAAFNYKSARVPSTSADSTGIFVRISCPNSTMRYSCGAPVAIYVCGGFGSSGMLGSMFTMSNYGFIVIEFNFPGGGSGTSKSGGTFDGRGLGSMMAIHDVIKYALGQKPDITGKYLHEITGAITPLYNNVGAIGGSNGGCNLLSALGLYGADLGSLAWISFFEAPVGDGMLTADPGKPYGHPEVLVTNNTAYNDTTGLFNWDQFQYDANLIIAIKKKDTLRGKFYFDLNNNGLFENNIDFGIEYKSNTPYSKHNFYSTQVTMHAYQKGFFPLPYSSVHFADSTLTKSYWNLRNGDKYIPYIMNYIPNLKVLFMVRADSDHITSCLNHPEVITAYTKFHNNDCSFFKVNPDRSYLELVSGQTLPTAPDNDGNVVLDNLNIRNMLIPGALLSNRYWIHYASTLELADRVMNEDWGTNVSGILTNLCPGGKTETEETVAPKLYPNPAAEETYVQFNAIEDGKVTLRVFDVIGRQVMADNISDVSKGFNLEILDLSHLVSGNYFVRIDAPGVSKTLQFTRE